MRIVALDAVGSITAPVTAIHFAPDGLTFAAVRRLDTWVVGLSWFDLGRNAAVVPPPRDPDHGGGAEEDAGYAPDPAVSTDHRFLAYVYIERGPEYSLRLIDRAAPKGSVRRQRKLTAMTWGEDFHNPQEYRALAFSPDGTFLVAVVAAGGEEEGGEEDEPEPGIGIYRWRVEAAMAGRGPTVRGDLLPGKVVFRAPPSDVDADDSRRSLAVSPNGNILAAGLWRTQVFRWEFPSGRTLPPLVVTPRQVKTRRGDPPFVPPAWRLAFSADGQTVAVADETVTLFDVGTVAVRATLPAGPAVRYGLGRPAGPYVHDLAFHPTERLLATACGDAILRWWDGTTGAAREAFNCGIGPLTAVAFSPDGCVCAAAGGKGQVALLDVDR